MTFGGILYVFVFPQDPQQRIKLRELLFLPEVRASITENKLVVPPFYRKLYDLITVEMKGMWKEREDE
jgi:hypothetical protein